MKNPNFVSSLIIGSLLMVAPSAISQSIDDYRSRQSGNWGSAATWERWDGSIWDGPVQLPPTSANSVITIRSGHTVTVNSTENADQLVLEAGGQITVNSGRTFTIIDGPGTDLSSAGTLHILGTLAINIGATTVVQSGGILRNSGTVTPTDTLIFNSGGIYQHNFTATEGTIPTATWNSGSTCEIIGYTSNTTAPVGLGQPFANFIWNCTNQTGVINLAGTLNTVNGDLTIISIGSGNLMLGFLSPGDLSVGGNFSQMAGTFIMTFNDFRAMTVAGNFFISGGTFNLSSGTNSGILNVAGNFDHTSGSQITETSKSVSEKWFLP